MKLESIGILIEMRSIGERDCVARIFTRDFGVLCGMMRGAQIAKKNRPLVGQVGNVAWNARIDSQLGVFHWESEKNIGAVLMMNPITLGFMNSAFALISTLLPERENYDNFFIHTMDLLNNLITNDSDANSIYLEWEINLLRELGYALNLTKCSGCNTDEKLNYLSPRTGRAVCDDCAAPYLDRLFRLPVDTETTKKFLEKIYEHHGGTLPLARSILYNRLTKN